MRVGADTNVLVRYLVGDDPAQGEAAAQAIEGATVVVSSVALCELVWVLRSSYRYGKAEIAELLRAFLQTDDIEIDRPLAEAGLAALEAGGDFADGVILADAARAGCDHVLSFDRGIPRLPGLPDVVAPEQPRSPSRQA